jgi:hypothetical protein
VVAEQGSTLNVWLDAGLVIELGLRSGVAVDRAIETMLTKPDLTPLVTCVNVRQS